MKIEVEDRDYTYPKIIMKTSRRGGKFSIRFEATSMKSTLYNARTGFWGHLTVSQSKRLIKELRDFVNWEVQSKARREHGI